MSKENTKYDELAKHLYDLWKEAHPKQEAFGRITRRDRDYWRALAQTYEGL